MTSNTQRKGFTLVEILVAVMLTGMLTTLALAPVVVTVRRVVETQTEYEDISALSRTMNFIARDLNSAMRLSSNVITIIDHEALGGNDEDILMIMSTAPTIQGLPSGTLVYKIEDGGFMHNEILPGLYRWVFPGKMPNAVKHENLKGNDPEAQLVLPGLNEFRVEVPAGSHEEDRRKDYSGQLPGGLYIKIGRKDKDNTSGASYQQNKNSLDEIERFIVFP